MCEASVIEQLRFMLVAKIQFRCVENRKFYLDEKFESLECFNGYRAVNIK